MAASGTSFLPGITNTLEAAANGETQAADMRPENWVIFWGSTVETAALQSNLATPGYFEFVAPHPVNDYNGLRHYESGQAMGTDFIAGGREGGAVVGYSAPLVGAGDGIWEIRREGIVVSKFDMRTSSPFDSNDGVIDLSYITNYVPTLELETGTDAAITSARVRFKTWDGSTYVDANASRAFSRLEVMGVSIFGDGSGGCNGSDEFDTVWDSVESDHLRYDVKGSWVLGAGDGSSCGVQSISVNYSIFGPDYSYSWNPTHAPFQIARYLGLDPANGVNGTYVSFRAIENFQALEWRGADLWFELSDIVTTPVAGLVSLGSGEDGVFHLRRQTGDAISFYLEYTGSGDPPASFEANATLRVHDGRPGRSKRSIAFPIAWSNSAAAPSATVSVTSYEELPAVFVPHGGIREFRANGSIGGVNQGDHFALSPASVAGWPADEYELVSTRVLLLNGGTLDLAAPPCNEPTCMAVTGNPADGLGFYAPESGDFDYQAFYTMRWTGAGSAPKLSSLVWNLGSSLVHALASDNNLAPSLQSTTPTSQMILSVSPSQLSIADAPLRVEYRASIVHNTTDGFSGDTVSITLPQGATVIPRTSTWLVTGFEDSLPEPTVQGQNYEWTLGSFIPIGNEAGLEFEVLLAPTTGEHVATGQAWVGNTAVDLTTTLGDDAPANATVTITP